MLGTFLIDAMGAAEIGQELLRAALAGAVPMTASLASATSISGLSVPLAWASVAPTMVQQAGMSLAAASTAAGTAAGAGETMIPAVGMAAAGLAGRAGAGASRGPTAGTTTPRPPSRRPNELPEVPVESAFGLLMGADIELRELAELRNAGILTDEEYTAEKHSLVGR
ncbi:MAG: SHOCT domain-containing protein [Mycobacterium sp.]